VGITPLTLGWASTRKGAKIPDHKSGEMVEVVAKYLEGSRNPIFRLVYSSGFTCRVRWQDGQAVPGYSAGVIPFVKDRTKQRGQLPKACHQLVKRAEQATESV